MTESNQHSVLSDQRALSAKPTQAAKPAVQILNLTAGYSRASPILKNVNLEISDREFFAIIGPNGGGKTTLIRVILGLIEPFGGQSLIYGQSIAQSRNIVGYVPQFSTCRRDFPITLQRMVELGLQNSSWQSEKKLEGKLENTSRFRNDAVLRVLEMVGLEAYAKLHIRELSGGQLQRALIAQALVRRPRLLILDEPTASIDPGGEASLLSLFESLVSKVTLVLVSHDVHYVMQAVTRVACVNRGIDVHEASDLCHLDHHEIYGKSMKPVSHNHHNHHNHHESSGREHQNSLPTCHHGEK